MICARYPMRIISALNAREHWAAKSRRVKRERQAAYYALLSVAAKPRRQDARYTVTLTRIAPRQITDRDNLLSGCKGTRDGVADWLGIDDGSEAVTWEYEQAKGRAYEVEIKVRATNAQ